MKTIINRRIALVLSVIILCPNLVRAEDRLWVDAKVNGKPVRLAVDTGATHAILFKRTAERLGLKYVIPTDIGAPPPNLVLGGKSEECEFKIWGSTFKTRLRIFDLPNYGRTEADGVLGWRTLARNIFFIDAGRNDVFALKELPEKVKSWQQFRLQQDAKYLTLIISDNGNTNIVVIDTGSESGINLAPEKWRAWKAAHPKQRLTLTGSYMPAAVGTHFRSSLLAAVHHFVRESRTTAALGAGEYKTVCRTEE